MKRAGASESRSNRATAMYGIQMRAQIPANGIEQAMLNDFHRRMAERDRELDEMIAMGWGGVDGNRIPADWRTRRGPGR